MEPLVGHRVLLRDHVLNDLDAVHAWISDEETMKYMSSRHTKSREETFVRFAKFIASTFSEDRGWFPLALVLKETEEVVGGIHLGYNHKRFGGGEGELGWFVRKDLWGEGLATEGAKLLAHFGFHTLGMDKIVASCIKGNVGSERIMQKLGMTKEAEHREDSIRFGERVNLLEYSVLKSEWAESGSSIL